MLDVKLDCVGSVYPRSSLWRTGVGLEVGVCDAGYLGALGGLLVVSLISLLAIFVCGGLLERYVLISTQCRCRTHMVSSSTRTLALPRWCSMRWARVLERSIPGPTRVL